jgi:hypothetical protein
MNKEFNRLIDASNKLDSIKDIQDKRIFSKEVKRSNKDVGRVYYVISPINLYQSMSLKNVNNIHEIIRENTPCLCYFDLEYCKHMNRAINGEELINIFLGQIEEYFQFKLEIKITRENVIDLESFYEEKFSRHLIVRFSKGQEAFTDNQHVGLFVDGFISYLSNKKEVNKELEKLWVETNNGKQIFIDKQVYSRNQSFRTLFSTKLGKNAPLKLSPQNKFSYLDEEDLFLKSLVTVNYKPVRLLHCESTLLKPPTISWSSATSLLTSKITNQVLQIHNSRGSGKGEIYKVVKANNTNDTFTNIYLISMDNKNRYCEGVGREHKSNQIYFLVNLDQKIFYQKCYDKSTCFNFKGKAYPININ